MEQVFKYRFDRRTKYLTPVLLLLIVAVCAALYYLYEGDYLSAWFLTTAIAVVALAVLSVPRSIRLGEGKVEIHCVLELTEIPYEEIVSVRVVPRGGMRGVVPVLGMWGFCGYYGIYFDFRSLERVRVYASDWRRLVEIVNVYEQRYVLSASDPEAFVAALQAGLAAWNPERCEA